MVQAYMRKNQRLIWAAIAIVVVITFVFWGSMTGSGPNRQTAGSEGTIYGHSVSRQEFLDAMRMVNAYFLLFSGQDFNRTEQGRQVLEQQTWLRLIERRKLDQWNITVPDEQVQKFIESMFTENGRFNREKYTLFLSQRVPALGLTESQFAQLMTEQLRLNELHKIIESTARVVPSEIRDVYNLIHEKLDLAVITFDGADEIHAIQPTAAEIQAYFDKNKEAFRIPERRRVRYVEFRNAAFTNDIKVTDAEVRAMYDKNKAMFVDEAGKPKPMLAALEGIRHQLVEQKAYERASEQATELALEIVKPKDDSHTEVDLTKVDFAALAKQFGVEVHESDFFTLRDRPSGIQAGPDFNHAAFALTAKEPFSDAVGGVDGAFVLQYFDQKPSEIPALDTVKARVVQELTQDRATELARQKGKDAARAIKNAVLAAQATNPGADAARAFADEARKLGVKVLNPPPFSQAQLSEAKIPEGAILMNVAFNMRKGEVSDFVDTASGGLFLLLKNRIEPTDAEFAKDGKEFEQQVVSRKRDLVYQDWANHEIMLAKPPFLNRPPPQPGAETPPSS